MHKYNKHNFINFLISYKFIFYENENKKQKNILRLCDNIFTFDIETSSVYTIEENHVAVDFESAKNSGNFDAYEKKGYCYLWSFGVDDNFFYGRTLDEFKDMLETLEDYFYKTKIIIYVHNLSFEFQFLINELTEKINVFARTERHPLKFSWGFYKNIEFRCSYFLTGMKLEKLTDSFKLPIKKLVGDVDYKKIRNSKTKLTKKDLNYNETDNKVVFELIKKFKEKYEHVDKIPLTMTGIVRRECQELFENDEKYHKKIAEIFPSDLNLYYFLMQAFAGGYTHANYIYVNQLLKNIFSVDEASSYPAQMCAKKYPLKFKKIENIDLDNLDKEKAYIFENTFENIEATTFNTYISYSKCTKINKFILDNGRVRKAETLTLVLTNVDYNIIKQCYKWQNCTVSTAYIANTEYLDKKYILKILDLYNKKTKLKHEDETVYLDSKRKINSLYGMMVTALLQDSVTFSAGEWGTKKLTNNKAQNELFKIQEKNTIFLVPQWGVWVTAYAREALWYCILKMDSNVVYDDTDSVKFKKCKNATKIINDYNKKITKELKTMCDFYNIEKNLLSPVDDENVSHPLGVFELELGYKQFKTLGAKKYAYIHKGSKDIEITIAGVPKSASKCLKKLDEFTKDFEFTDDESGKKGVAYNDNQSSTILIDYQGNKEYRKDKYGICIYNTSYKVNNINDYETEYYTTFLNQHLNFTKEEK